MKTVLILDDDEAFRELLTPLIEARGRRCLGAGTVAEALSIVGAEDPELVIVDYMLPDGNGGEFVAALRARASRTVLVCLSASLTGWAHFEQMQAEQDISLVLRKPIFPKSFGVHLDDLLPVETSAEAVTRVLGEKMAELHRQYVEALPAKLDALTQAIGRARDAPSESAHLEVAISLAHRLHGTAASYGCPAVGRAAGRIERAIEGLASAELSVSEAWAEIDEAVDLAIASLK